VSALRFGLGLHLHQPVGNFDSVFTQHLEEVYRPLLQEVIGGGCAPATLHLSGPLLDWLAGHAGDFLDQLGVLVADGKVELLLAGYDEPILAALAPADRLEQIGRMRDTLRARFGVTAEGLWLTERVWEPDLAGDLHAAGVRYVLVDDRHFLAAGFERDALFRPWLTEHGGRQVTLLPIDERLRYLVPFRPPAELEEYLRALHREEQPLAILADDGEKFGGWPGTFEWVYRKGWLRDFLAALDRLRDEGVVRLVSFGEAVREVAPRGPAYLPTASYREMEGWALPPAGARRLAALEAELGTERLSGAEAGLLRGSHWRNFLTRYSESNRMHKKALALSALCRERGDPPAARRAIGRAQCNDAYWHGVFGGLYLPHLRHAIWRELATAERELRQGEGLSWTAEDLDCDGATELAIHSGAFSAVISPARGGALEELLQFDRLLNLAATLTRRREAYHETAGPAPPSGESDQPDSGAPSIHELEQRLVLEELPPVDRDDRALFQERVWQPGITPEAIASLAAEPVHSWTRGVARWDVRTEADALVVRLELEGLVKTFRIGADGELAVTLAWEHAAAWPAGTWFTTELSLAHPVELDAPRAARWSYPIATVAKSEKGLERTVQGEAVVLAWPVEALAARVTLRSGEPVTEPPR
jgi:alpha-amylase